MFCNFGNRHGSYRYGMGPGSFYLPMTGQSRFINGADKAKAGDAFLRIWIRGISTVPRVKGGRKIGDHGRSCYTYSEENTRMSVTNDHPDKTDGF